MDFHPYAELFPMMSPAEMKELRVDMRENGYQAEFPIIVYEGKILDGRNRYAAALAEGIEPVYQDFIDHGNPLKYVIRTNLHRRHLNESQRAMCAARLANIPSGKFHGNQSVTANLQSPQTSQAEAAKMLNVSPRSVATAKKVLEEAPPEIIADIDAGKLAVSQYARRFTRQEKMQEISEGNKVLEASGKRYSVIYADPPWKYDFSFSDSRAIEEHYPTMELEDIIALPVKELTADHSLIFLWCPPAFIKKAIAVLEAWGFEYRTNMVWVKPSIGAGQWVRQRHELLLIGRRGNIPTPEGSDRPDSVIEAPRQEHSKKPEIVYSIIEKMYPTLRKVELFARNKRDGWESWGNQV
jgi:N6-adenosine-specific RNA methylase IME4